MKNDRVQEQFNRFERTLRTEGHKLTTQRLAVYRELTVADDHPSAEALFGRLHKKLPMLSRNTVYRTLALLAKRGLITKVETVENQSRFDGRCEPHHHVICNRCHKIIDFHCPPVNEVLLPKEIESWGTIESKILVIYGICGKCLDK